MRKRHLRNCDIYSAEFGWSVRGIEMEDCAAQSEYFMMRSSELYFNHVQLKGKYSFQYIENAVFENCQFDTKDAFWHAKNVVVRDSVVKGEYLAWYCENVTFENCQIIGAQPLCYCKGLRLVNCAMNGTDLAFERSEVEATITTPVVSIKNPLPATSMFQLWEKSSAISMAPMAKCTFRRVSTRAPVHRERNRKGCKRMIYRTLPHGGEKISIIGLGNSSIGSSGEEETEKTIALARKWRDYFDMAAGMFSFPSPMAVLLPIAGKACISKYLARTITAENMAGRWIWKKLSVPLNGSSKP